METTYYSAEFLAESLYTHYCNSVGGKAFNGEPLPNWSEFRNDKNKTTQADAWVGVAKLAITTLLGEDALKKPDWC